MIVEDIEYNGWKNNIRVANKEIELICTKDIGPRIIRLGFINSRNIFGELPGQQGGAGEDEWILRGGHRLWIAPEEKPKTYELDNSPIEVEKTDSGIKTIQPVGPLSNIKKTMEISLSDERNEVSILHRLSNKGNSPVELSSWALTVMAREGTAIIPLPEKISHSDRLTHNQEWSLWGYTDFSDDRWRFGSRYIFFRQDPAKGPNKLGIMHREGWVAYLLEGILFVKCFTAQEGLPYPDGGVNFETFANEDILELESLSPLVVLQPGESVEHTERWLLYRDVGYCESDEDVDTNILPLIKM